MSKRATSSSSSSEPGLRPRRLTARDREAALGHLRRRPRDDLFLIDLVSRLGLAPEPGEGRAELVGVYDGPLARGIASLRPSLVFDADFDPGDVALLRSHLAAVGFGLIKCPGPVASACWEQLAGLGRRAFIDRTETASALTPDAAALAEPAAGQAVRAAQPEDLDELVHAARASLREEGRPDPFDGDPPAFVRWVRGRMPKALLVETGGRIGFVGYADVRRPEGWLLQGVYTWPAFRRRGLAAVGVSALCRAAYAAGADHVQLAVVDGNLPAERLYERLGFRPFGSLRTILFG